MPTKNQITNWRRALCQATPRERRLIDRLEEARPDMAPLKVLRREPTVILLKPAGCYGVTWDWIRREIRRASARLRREKTQAVIECIGAGI